MQRIHIIDSHTGGEPTRVVLAGFPDLGGGPLNEQRERLAREHDRWRRAALLEPRGSAVLVGALLRPPVNPQHTAGVIFFNNSGYLGMCGHGTIGLVATLAHLGRIAPGGHVIETPVGDITATLHADGQVSVRNVPSYRLAADVAVPLPGGQVVHGDIAWGGNWFFLCADHGQAVKPGRVAELTAYAAALRTALHAQGLRGADGAEIDHIELFAPDPGGADSRSFVLCPGMEYDRSPCGTGTSAKLACLAARGELAPGQVWHQASVIGSVFTAWYERGHGSAIVPTIQGRAFITAEAALLVDPHDPFGWGLP